MASKISLPAGWEYSFDSQGKIFYIDHNTQTTSYNPPSFHFNSSPSYYSSPSVSSSLSSVNSPVSLSKEKANGGETSAVLEFELNGKKQRIENPDPLMSLNEYIRTKSGFTGTKKTCGEGGCGVCTVVVKAFDPSSNSLVSHSTNSCLKPLCSLQGAQILTTEGIGSSKKGFHPIQDRIGEHNGSQCGHCTPGFVMNMFDLLENNSSPSSQQIEDHFDGNLCRCTGYRPILNAFQTFAAPSSIPLSSEEKGCKTAFGLEIKDIEELKSPVHSAYSHSSPFRSSCQSSCATPCSSSSPPPSSCSHKFQSNEEEKKVKSLVNGKEWRTAANLGGLIEMVKERVQNRQKYRLIAGNTSTGIYKSQFSDFLIDISKLSELGGHSFENNLLSFGSVVTISDLIQLIRDYLKSANSPLQSSNFEAFIKHLQLIANVQVRNSASWTGNLMITNQFHFTSDLATLLMALDARINLIDALTSAQKSFGMEQFLTMDLYGKIVKGMGIPIFQSGERFLSFKQALRHENSHALINAAFRVRLNDAAVIQSIRIVYGGALELATRAKKTEDFLIGKEITNQKNLEQAVDILKGEIIPVETANNMKNYRSSLILSFFYKFWLGIQPSLPPPLQSAAATLERGVSRGSHSYKDDPKEYPVSKAIPKVDIKLQASGEAKYTDDFLPTVSTLYGSLVLSTVANATLGKIDATAALNWNGVVAFYTSKDIDKTRNYCGPTDLKDEQVFADSKIEYAGQPIGIIVADTQRHADEAAKMVKVEYTNLQAPILTLDEAIEKKSWMNGGGGDKVSSGDAPNALKNAKKVIKGRVSCGAQMHFHMEPHAVSCTPDEDGQFKVFGSLQWAKATQRIVASVLGKQMKEVTVATRRLGGSYGSKISRNIQSFCAVAFASQQLNLPVKMFMDLNTTMETSGRRNPFRVDYQFGLDENNKIVGVILDVYTDNGAKLDGGNGVLWIALHCIDNCYFSPNVLFTPYFCKTNNPPSTSMRGPGWVPAIFLIESIMEKVALEIGVDGDKFRQLNFYSKGQVTPYGQTLKYFSMNEMWNQVIHSSDYTNRKAAVDQFNSTNRWVKKGISLVPCKFGLGLTSDPQGALVDVMGDGTIVISHSGVEMGQGINTKVIQTAAMSLKIPMEMIRVVDSSTLTVPGAEATGGSTTSELCCEAVRRACQDLLKKLEPVQKLSGGTLDWKSLIAKATSAGMDLQSKGWVNFANNPLGPWTYNSYSIAALEVELDVLTGNFQILRVDILFDCGISLNPAVDFGQIEGAFMQGIGYATTECLIIDPKTGQLISNGTWEYKIPSHKDIPIDMRVSLLDDAPNPVGILSSKATGEPPLALGCSVVVALRRAIQAARKELGNKDQFELDSPCTVAQIQTACLVNPKQFTL